MISKTEFRGALREISFMCGEEELLDSIVRTWTKTRSGYDGPDHPLAVEYERITKDMWAAIEDRAEALKSFKEKHILALAHIIDEMDEPNFSPDPEGETFDEDPKPPEPVVTLLTCVFILANPSYEENSDCSWVLNNDWTDMKAMLIGDP